MAYIYSALAAYSQGLHHSVREFFRTQVNLQTRQKQKRQRQPVLSIYTSKQISVQHGSSTSILKSQGHAREAK